MTISPSADSRHPPGRRHRLAEATVLAVVLSVTGICALEVLFRAVVFPEWRAMKTATFVHHPVYGSFQKPNLAARRYSPPNYDVVNHTNSLGFRDREEGFRERDLQGVWIAGSSNTFGPGIADDQVYASAIEGLGYPAADLASEGHRVNSQALVIRDLAGQGYRPRAVILEMTMNNTLIDARPFLEDFDHPLPRAANVAGDRLPAERLADSLVGLRERLKVDLMAVKTKLINNSAIYGWLKVGINAIPALRRLTLDLGWRSDVALATGGPVELMRDMRDNPADPLLDSTAAFIVRLKKWVDEHLGVPFGVLLIPSHYQLDTGRFQHFVDHFGYREMGLDAARPLHELDRRLKAANIPTLDVTPALLATGSRHLTFPDDAHMTAEAHAVVAAELAKWLERDLRVAPQR